MTPHHTLQHDLLLRASHTDHADLLRMMGYPALSHRHHARLRRVLTDPLLGLARSEYDFRYGSHAFALTLCGVLGVPEQEAQQTLDGIRENLDREAARFQPSIFVDTGFRRTTQPIFALAACEWQRHPALNAQELAEYHNLALGGQVRLIAGFVRRHYREHQGELGIWGTIQRYHFHYEPERALILLPNGVVTADESRQPPQQASVSVGGRPLPRIR